MQQNSTKEIVKLRRLSTFRSIYLFLPNCNEEIISRNTYPPNDNTIYKFQKYFNCFTIIKLNVDLLMAKRFRVSNIVYQVVKDMFKHVKLGEILKI